MNKGLKVSLDPRLFFFILLLSGTAFGRPESRFGEIVELLGTKDAFFTSTFKGAAEVRLSMTSFGKLKSQKGCVVISPGQAEPALKYLEIATDLLDRGYGPVFALDHRGQGGSDRLIQDRQKGYVDQFSYYVEDFAQFVSIVHSNPICSGHTLSLLAHSMGGAIATSYLQKYSETPIQRAVLVAPMLKIKFPEGASEMSIHWKTYIACLFKFTGRCLSYAEGGPWRAENAHFMTPDGRMNRGTHSKARFEFKKAIFAKWPELQLGSPTVAWVYESISANVDIRSPRNIGRLKTPILILQAGDDEKVDNSGQDELCRRSSVCKLERFQQSKHDLLMEVDALRDPAMDMIDSFFEHGSIR